MTLFYLIIISKHNQRNAYFKCFYCLEFTLNLGPNNGSSPILVESICFDNFNNPPTVLSQNFNSIFHIKKQQE